MSEKSDLRRRMRAMRGKLTKDDLERAGRAVVSRVLDLSLPGPVLLYVSVRRELPTEPLFGALWGAGVDVAVPAMRDRVAMEARRRRAGDRLEPDAMGIPTSSGAVLAPATVICPGLAFDRAGRRLGYGGGAYDRWFAEAGPLRRVGLCVDDALVDEVPAEPHDVRMDLVVTPSGVVTC